jgi:hypothetical protein
VHRWKMDLVPWDQPGLPMRKTTWKRYIKSLVANFLLGVTHTVIHLLDSPITSTHHTRLLHSQQPS